MKNIYDKINDLEVSYKEEELTDLERNRIINKSKKYSNKKSKLTKVIGLAAAFGLIFSMSIPSVRASVTNFASNIQISIIDTIGSSQNSKKYVTSLKDPIDLDGKTIKIENLVFDGDRMYIDILSENPSTNDNPETPHLSHVKINGEVYKIMGSSGQSHQIDKENKITIYSMMSNFDKNLPQIENADVSLYFDTSLLTAKVVNLKANINIADENLKTFADNLEIKNTNGAILEYMKANPITLTAKISNLEKDYVYCLEGYDKDNNKIELDLRYADKDVFNFFLNPNASDLNLDQIRDGREITFELSRAKMNTESGKETSEDNKKFGDSFTLKAK